MNLAVTPVTGGGTSPDPVRVLLVEDSPSDAAMVWAMLASRRPGAYSFASARNLDEARARIEEHPPACVLLDLGLPDSDGLATLDAVLGLAPDLATVVLTGQDDEMVGQLAVARGAEDYLVKGRTDGEVLERTLRYAIERRQAQLARLRSEERFRATVGLLGPLLVLSAIRDDRGECAGFRFEYANQAATALCQGGPEGVVGLGLTDALPPGAATRLSGDLRLVVDKGAIVEGEIDLDEPDDRTFEYRASKLDDGCVVLAKDVTARQRAEADIAGLNARLHQHVAELFRLQDVARSLSTTLDPESVTNLVGLAVGRVLPGASRFGIALFDEAAGAFRWIAVVVGGEAVDAGSLPPLPLDAGPMGDAYRSGIPVAVDYRERPFVLPPIAGEDAPSSGLYIPLVVGRRRIGVLDCHSTTPYAFRDIDLNLLGALAGQAAAAIENSRLYSDVASHAEELAVEVEERAADLAAVSSELEGARRDLEGFAYAVAHDLRSPLRAIHGFSTVLLEDHAPHLDEEGRRALSRVLEAVGRMDNLVEGLLTFTRLGHREPRTSLVDMTELATSVVDELARASPRDDVSVTISPLEPILGDRVLLRDVWYNLIDNALKFTTRVSPARIDITSTAVGGAVVYSVADNGVGFDMAYSGKLFGVFERLHGRQEFPGVGIGLAVVRRIVARHGGSVWAEGRVGHGATFKFSLPEHPPSHAAPGAVAGSTA